MAAKIKLNSNWSDCMKLALILRSGMFVLMIGSGAAMGRDPFRSNGMSGRSCQTIALRAMGPTIRTEKLVYDWIWPVRSIWI